MCVRVDLLETMASQRLAKMGCTLHKWRPRLKGDLQTCTSCLDLVCKTAGIETRGPHSGLMLWPYQQRLKTFCCAH